MPGCRTAHDREDLVFAVTAAVISTGDEKYACAARMTPQDIHRLSDLTPPTSVPGYSKRRQLHHFGTSPASHQSLRVSKTPCRTT